jgi:hypothetical protein
VQVGLPINVLHKYRFCHLRPPSLNVTIPAYYAALGHRPQLMPAKYVRPFARGQKNDFNDVGRCTASAIASAAGSRFSGGHDSLRVTFLGSTDPETLATHGRTIHMGQQHVSALGTQQVGFTSDN